MRAFLAVVTLVLVLIGCSDPQAEEQTALAAALKHEEAMRFPNYFECLGMGTVALPGGGPVYFFDLRSRKPIAPEAWLARGCDARYQLELWRQAFLRMALSNAYFLKNVPPNHQERCGRHVWVGRAVMAIDGQASIYDLRTGEAIARCGGLSLRTDPGWEDKCPALMEEMNSCFPPGQR
jgi:hypothetical protein